MLKTALSHHWPNTGLSKVDVNYPNAALAAILTKPGRLVSMQLIYIGFFSKNDYRCCNLPPFVRLETMNLF
jgi:hypothetical protein